MILVHRIANLDVKCEPTPLAGWEIAAELSAGRQIWTDPDGRSLRGARPGDEKLLREHRCPVSAREALSRPRTPSKVPSVQSTPPRPPAGRTAPSSGPSAAPSSVRSAETRDSDGREDPSLHSGPRCDDCGLIMADGDYVSAQLGEIYIWAQHTANCR